MENYIITATCKQVELLSLACNQAMRIHIGQLADPLTVQLNFEIGYLRHHNGGPAPMDVQEKLEELSKLCWLGILRFLTRVHFLVIFRKRGIVRSFQVLIGYSTCKYGAMGGAPIAFPGISPLPCLPFGSGKIPSSC